MSRFSNAFWSPDYVSGIDKLSRSSRLSLGQLHELRKFVFNYMKYFHNNGEYLANLADSSYPNDSSFRNSRGQRQGRAASGVPYNRVHHGSEVELDFDMDCVFRQFIERTRKDSRLNQKAASDIDQYVLDRITIFLKHNEPQVQRYLADLDELHGEYSQAYDSVELAKQEYTNIARLGEFQLDSDLEKESADPHLETHEESQQEINSGQKMSENEAQTSHTQITGMQFPFVIAGMPVFPDQASFITFIGTLVRTVSVTRRKIPLPGSRNEIFSSESFCEAATIAKPRGFNPSRSNLEKLGQALIDSKILIGTGFFARKFNSEGMWFEWSEVAVEISEPGSGDPKAPAVPPKSDETWSSVTSSTTKRLNNVFKSMQSTLSKPRYSESELWDSEEKYNDAYNLLQKQRHLLDMKVLDSSRAMEQFEKAKIELVYSCLAQLSQILRTSKSTFSTEFDAFSEKFVSQMNKPENYLLEFDRSLLTFSTGIYFPSLLAPNSSASRHVTTSQLNTNFQNIRLNFNLFKDIPLQASLKETSPDTLLSLQSIPVFLFEGFQHLETFPIEERRAAWIQPLNYQQYWLMKDDLTSELQGFRGKGSEIAVVQNPDTALMKIATSYLKDKNCARSVNFMKNWLLEISDSVIPSTVHDSLITNYKISRESEKVHERIAETLKICGAMPRSNLGSLLFILESICQTFGLDPISGFGTSDDIAEKTPEESEQTLHELAAHLNSSDAIAAVPFAHLIMRPSVVKHAAGYRPPFEQQNMLLQDLLALNIRQKLFQVLVASEKSFLKRQEEKKYNLGIQKRHAATRERSASTKSNQSPVPQIDVTGSTETNTENKGENETLHKSPQPVKADNFELRPFRTGNTPRPSPSPSPGVPKSKGMGIKSPPISLAPLKIDLEDTN